MHNNIKTKPGLLARLDHMFTDREFFMRSHGQVRFLKFSAKLQKRIAGSIAAVLGIWLVVTLAMTVNQFTVSRDRMALAAKEAEINSTQNRVAAYKSSVEDVAADLNERQDALDQITKQFIGNDVAKQATGSEKLTADEKKILENTKKISAAFPAAGKLAALEARQILFAKKLTRAAMKRSTQAEVAIRKFGLNPDKLAANMNASGIAMGGPLIPFFSSGSDDLHPTLERLSNALTRMDALERTLLAIPSAMPTSINMMTSNYGYRRDPITGGGAMHSGIDFKGPHGQPILSAAKGKVTHAGWKSGYGKTVEITHGNGLMTRYAHLSRVNVATGQNVTQGLQVGLWEARDGRPARICTLKCG
nr:M23 family metallopeptidase [Parasphingorhabdus halotolerans]